MPRKLDDSSERPLRRYARWLLGALFIGAGMLHFIAPGTYESVMPPYLPAHRLMVLVSGAFEIAGGVGLLIPALRRAAAWGLALLLVAVFPANVHMALHPEVTAGAVAPWLLWARLLLQPVLIGLVLWAGEGMSWQR